MGSSDSIFTAEINKELERRSREWLYADQKRKIENFDIMNENATKGGIVFVGDSITQMYPVHEFFSTHSNIYNRGISGYTSRQLKNSLDSMVNNLDPNIVFLLIGTNDLSFDITPTEAINNIKTICDDIVQNVENVKIYLISIYPVIEGIDSMVGERTNKDISYINSVLIDFAGKANAIEYVDLVEVLSENNELNPTYTYDGLHLNMLGYKAITPTFKKLLEEK